MMIAKSCSEASDSSFLLGTYFVAPSTEETLNVRGGCVRPRLTEWLTWQYSVKRKPRHTLIRMQDLELMLVRALCIRVSYDKTITNSCATVSC